MILRVEDTDAERNKPELVQGILDGLKWLGVDWDEGPFYQSQRTELYRAAAKKLLANGSACLCYCAAEKYAGGDHAEEGTQGSQVRRVTRCSCRDGKPSIPRCETGYPLQSASWRHDEIFRRGIRRREFSNDEIEDFVLLGVPARAKKNLPVHYQLGVVVDDIDMRITHVIRRARTTFRTRRSKVLLYRALGAEPPEFLAHGPANSRCGQIASVETARARPTSHVPHGRILRKRFGFSRAARMVAGGDEEFIRTKDLIEKFSLAGVSRTNAVFDRPKRNGSTRNICKNCLSRNCSPEVENELKRSGLWRPEWAASAAPGPDGRDHAWFAEDRGSAAGKNPAPADFSSVVARFFSDDFTRDPARHRKILERSESPGAARELADALESLSEWEPRRLRSSIARGCGSRGRSSRLANPRHFAFALSRC